jgi:hypothetical protein
LSIRCWTTAARALSSSAATPRGLAGTRRGAFFLVRRGVATGGVYPPPPLPVQARGRPWLGNRTRMRIAFARPRRRAEAAASPASTAAQKQARRRGVGAGRDRCVTGSGRFVLLGWILWIRDPRIADRIAMLVIAVNMWHCGLPDRRTAAPCSRRWAHGRGAGAPVDTAWAGNYLPQAPADESPRTEIMDSARQRRFPQWPPPKHPARVRH